MGYEPVSFVVPYPTGSTILLANAENSIFRNFDRFLVSGVLFHRRALVLEAQTKVTVSRLGVRMPEDGSDRLYPRPRPVHHPTTRPSERVVREVEPRPMGHPRDDVIQGRLLVRIDMPCALIHKQTV